MKSVASLLAASLVAVVLATPAKADRWHYLVEQRLAEHGRLIEEGRRDGSLTFFEVRALRAEQARIRATAHRLKGDGSFNRYERAQVRELQDAASTHIFSLRNNAQRRRFAFWY